VTGSAAYGIFVSASDDVLVANNTLDDNQYGVVVHGMPRAHHPRLRNNRVEHNVIGYSRAADLVLYENAADASGNSSDHNLFARGDRSIRVAITKDRSYRVTHTDLRAFAKATGHDRTSRSGDPRWVDRAGGDYRLLPDSPARRAVPVPAGAVTAAADLGARHMGAHSEDVLASPRARAARRIAAQQAR
jgi:parallel beta-helix repeat protein